MVSLYDPVRRHGRQDGALINGWEHQDGNGSVAFYRKYFDDGPNRSVVKEIEVHHDENDSISPFGTDLVLAEKSEGMEIEYPNEVLESHAFESIEEAAQKAQDMMEENY